ncbi:hypothetical protein GALMADRAFT_157649 [Galerina marginata CBS 339.88]|uniref:F-box domain-containing protein n=1 Tax=Galerina marginata (strain CBS 339.88) TaxID=685588 RepID=A0A067T646_GALM3|nr:hypothetical protein GALMADRAFT_157649 [Galerina marginata CBS 339.88]
MASSVNTSTWPTLPQEIVNLLVQEVANPYRNNPGPLQLDTLKACSLISRSFHAESRRHIFSSIEFRVDRTAQRRAARLAKVLEHKNSDNLLSVIRAVKLVIDVRVSSSEDELPRYHFDRLVRKLGLSENNLLRVLRILNRAPLESFAIIAQGGYVNWSANGSPTIAAALRQICSNQSLKSLRIVNVMNIEQSMVVDAFSSGNLRELALCNVNIKRMDEVSAPTHESGPRSFGKLEKLEMSLITYSSLFSSLQSSFPPSSSSPNTFSLNLSTLRSLDILLPKVHPALDILWQLMLGTAQSLETLVLQDNPWPASTLSPDGPIDLSCLTSLQTLKFSACALNSGVDLASRQATLANLITSATSSITIQSIVMQFYVKSLPHTRNADLNTWKTIMPGSEWSLLDASLARPALANLRRIIIDVNLFYEDPSIHSLSSEIMESSIDIHAILPSISALPSINVTANLKSIFSSEPLLTYKSYYYHANG